MFRFFFILAIGVSLGYWVGFKDGRTHKQDIVARMVARAGGATRSEVRTDVDQAMSKVEDGSDR